ncbi:MAG: IPExxxVDY family protein [Bacteroidota bacterium]|nr:IPExxxVDY family protein [Bacteroidota bacterium]
MSTSLSFQDFFVPENNLYFIVSANEPAYKVAWAMNKFLKMSFQRVKDHELKIHHQVHYFELFEFEDEAEQIWKLIKTKSTKGAFIADKNISMFDYIIILQNPINGKKTIGEFIRKIRSIVMIRLIQELRFEMFSGKTIYNLPI